MSGPEIILATDLRPAFWATQAPSHDHALALLVKGTFDLQQDERAVASGDQAFATGDEPYPDDDEGSGASRYSSDFAPFKPRADLLLAGHCHPPGGVTSCDVTFAVGAQGRTLRVCGDRRWERHLVRRKATAPEPFQRMELRYERSYGGPKFAPNPVGRGHKSDGDEEGEGGWYYCDSRAHGGPGGG